MKTTKPISTISYNSDGFLAVKLGELQKAKIVSFWAFVRHMGEDDEGGLKDHVHLYIEPASSVQTVDLEQAFKEFDPEHPDKPFGCISFRSSKFDDWYMYSAHDVSYLAVKGLVKKFHYHYDDFIYSSEPDFRFRYKSIDMAHLTPVRTILDAQSQGLTFREFALSGRIPFRDFPLYKSWWYTFESDVFYDNAPVNTTKRQFIVDKETGEVCPEEEKI